MEEFSFQDLTVVAFERNWHGSSYRALTIRNASGDEVKINCPQSGKGLYVSPNEGEVRAYTPYPYDEEKNQPLSAGELAERLHLTDTNVWRERVLRTTDKQG
jgi:hypothetical protein